MEQAHHLSLRLVSVIVFVFVDVLYAPEKHIICFNCFYLVKNFLFVLLLNNKNAVGVHIDEFKNKVSYFG